MQLIYRNNFAICASPESTQAGGESQTGAGDLASRRGEEAEFAEENERKPEFTVEGASALAEDEGTESGETSVVKELRLEIGAATQKYKETYEKMLRIAADFENSRKRWEKERSDVRVYAIQEFARDLLPVIDAFDKAMTAIESSGVNLETEEGKRVAAVVEGVQLVSRVFKDAIKKHGIERLPGVGEPFNPLFHNAVARVVDTSYTQDTVVDEFVPGYKIGERVLRTAMVRVGTKD